MNIRDMTILDYAKTLGHPVVTSESIQPGVVEVNPRLGVTLVHPDAYMFTIRMNAGIPIPLSTVKTGGLS